VTNLIHIDQKFIPVLILFFSFFGIPSVCLSVDYQIGPFDYTNSEDRNNWLGNVEHNHFNSDVENLKKGITGTVFDDLDYTLRIFPNHHRALYAMAKLFRQTPQPSSTKGIVTKTPYYYFQRAMQIAPHDAIVPMIYGIHLHKLRKLSQAQKQYEKAIQIDPNLVEAHYNLGLLLVDRKEYDLAFKHADFAYRRGYPLQGLRIELQQVGAWHESNQK
jgi:Tfp pilus assembly protein PilF